MICPNCSAACDENAAVCENCGQALAAVTEKTAAEPAIKDYLTLNIVLLAVTCLCVGCTPALATGILGVVFSTQVRSLLSEGKAEEAQKKAQTAKYLAIATGALVLATVLFLIAYFVIFFAFYGVAFGTMIAEMEGLFGLLVH